MGGDTTTKALFMYYVCFMFTMAHTHKHTHWFTTIVVPTPPPPRPRSHSTAYSITSKDEMGGRKPESWTHGTHVNQAVKVSGNAGKQMCST